ncbi:hypothetical protein [Sutcliffiella cohnii]|uniref:hypothetical protein n=1 Tax=Sutcliffiella cohnii TaxID=33932 RepID=UPI000830E88B|nr:hypothetical protein [Sutcliffiella cohnii]
MKWSGFNRYLIIFFIAFGTFIIPATITFANSDVPDFVKQVQRDSYEIEEKKANDLWSTSNKFDSWIAPVYTFGINILTIIFIAGIIGMSFSIITKTGHWMKWAWGSMIISFIVLLILRIGPILLLTTNVIGITLIVNDSIHLLKVTAFWAAIGMVLVGLAIRLLHIVVSHHPEYFRWSQGLFVGAFILGFLSGVIPLLFRVV